jgi:hypothetical protein
VTTRITQACSVTTSDAAIAAIQIRCETISWVFNSMNCSQHWVFTHYIYTTCPLNGGSLCCTAVMNALRKRKIFCPGRESVRGYNSSRSLNSQQPITNAFGAKLQDDKHRIREARVADPYTPKGWRGAAAPVRLRRAVIHDA